MNKYKIAAVVAIANLDDNTYRKLTAAKQRELFGYNVFGKQNVRFNSNGQGTVEVSASAAYGTDNTWTMLNYEELAVKINNKQQVRA